MVEVGVMRSAAEREFTDYVRARSGPLLRTAWYLCGDPVLAEELVQEALTRLYVRWPRLTRDGRPVEPYVHRVLVNLHIDETRRRRRETSVGQAPDVPARSSRAEHVDVVRALAALPPRQRQVVVLRHLADLPEREVADILGVSLGAVKSAASDGRRTLRTALGGDHVHS